MSFPVLPQARQGDRWSWDPDEERKRQERWQQEQERMLQVHSSPEGAGVCESARLAVRGERTRAEKIFRNIFIK